jgi:hypothetical protein
LSRRAAIGLLLALGLLFAGIALAIASALAAGDWYAPYQPAMELALPLIIFGLAGAHVFGLVVVALSPHLGWWRLLATVPAVVVGSWWIVVLILGVPTTGFGGPARGAEVLIYSNPEWAAKLIGAPTVALAGLALVGVWLDRSRVVAAPHT